MSKWPKFIERADLAPGDSSPHPALPRGLTLHVVESPADPLFEPAFKLLENEFAAKGGTVTREIVKARMHRKPAQPVNGCGMLYNLILLMVGDDCAAVQDHTAIARTGSDDIVVHLSHTFVAPKWRRKGLAAIQRTTPIITARACALAVTKPESPITLFCEMDPIDHEVPANRIRRTSYGQAGFQALGTRLGYVQPDLRPAAAIDADPNGPKPVLSDILLRRVGREKKTTIGAEHLIANIEMVYAMYAADLRETDMAPCKSWLEDLRTKTVRSYNLYPPLSVK
jgi:hypothetical protein